jgi:DNA-binding transcriptional LysR family regulator
MVSSKGEVPEFETHVSVSVDSVAALRTLALRGMGVAAIPRVLVESDIEMGALVARDVAR